MPPKGIINIRSNAGFIRLDDFDDVKKREKFISVFNPKGKRLLEVIGDYEFDDEIHCGLKDCNQPHKKGFIVLTSTEEETNIGNNCGEKIFGHIQFSSLRKSYKTDFEIENNRQIIRNSLPNLENWYQRLISHYNKSPYNARWAWESIINILQPSVIGEFAFSELNKMKRTLNGKVVVDIVATAEEAQILQAQGKKPPFYIEKSLGEVKCVSVLSQGDELKKLVLDDIKETLKRIEDVNPDTCDDYKLLSDIAKRANNVESNFKKIDSIVENAKKFFEKQNFAPLYEKLENYYSGWDKNINIKAFSNFINSLPSRVK
jgi:hypothetical protein